MLAASGCGADGEVAAGEEAAGVVVVVRIQTVVDQSQPCMHDTSVVMCGMQNHIRFYQCRSVITEALSLMVAQSTV